MDGSVLSTEVVPGFHLRTVLQIQWLASHVKSEVSLDYGRFIIELPIWSKKLKRTNQLNIIKRNSF